MSNSQPVIIVRRKKVVAAHGYSSAWKIAFADFAVAMMAFFLVLWLTESTSLEEQQAISGYFTDPVGFEDGGQKYIIDLGGSGDKVLAKADEVQRATVEEAKSVIDAETVQALAAEIENQQFQELAEEIREVIKTTEALKPLEEQVQLSVTKEGLQIQILDQESRPMFDSGSDEIKNHASDILSTLGQTIAKLPNRISIAGHTDASGFAGRRDYSNWELSSERANAARRVLQRNGVREKQVTRVVGKGSSSLYLPEDPFNPINRRISILVLSKQSEEDLKEQFEGLQAPGVKMDNFKSDPELGHTKQSELPESFAEQDDNDVDAAPDSAFDFESVSVPPDASSSEAADSTNEFENTPNDNVTADPTEVSAGFDSFSFDDEDEAPGTSGATSDVDDFSFDSPAALDRGAGGSVSTEGAGAASAVDTFDFESPAAESEPRPASADSGVAEDSAATSQPERPSEPSPSGERQSEEALQPTASDLPVIVTPEEKPWWEQ